MFKLPDNFKLNTKQLIYDTITTELKVYAKTSYKTKKGKVLRTIALYLSYITPILSHIKFNKNDR